MSCSNNLLEFNFGDNTGRQERIKNIIFRNGLNASLVRSIPCTGDTHSVSEELQTFARENRGIGDDLITRAKNTILLDGKSDLLGNTTYWNEDNTYISTTTVGLSGIRSFKTYEHLGVFTGLNSSFTTDYENVADGLFKLIEAVPTTTFTTLTSVAISGSTKLYVDSTSSFNTGDFIIIDKDAANPLNIELFQIESKTSTSITLRTPSVDKNEFPPNGTLRNHLTGTKVYKTSASEKTESTDYSILLSTGDITIVPANFTSGSFLFFNYTYNTYYLYSEGPDYEVDYEDGIITRKTTGNIPIGETVLVDYQFNQPCIDPKTGAPRRNCGECNGFGFISLPTENIRGLFHIPNYDSPLTQAGYWQKGDAFFTVPELSNFSDITAEPKGSEGFFVRDMLIIDNKYWLVMSKPQSFNLSNKFLGRKLHLRMISE